MYDIHLLACLTQKVTTSVACYLHELMLHLNGYNKTNDMLRSSLSNKNKKLTVVFFKN